MFKKIETESIIIWKCKWCGDERTEWKELPPPFYEDIEEYK